MKRIDNMDVFLANAARHLKQLKSEFDELPVLALREFSPDNTVLVNVDINNGFCRFGGMASPRVAEIIPDAVRLNALFKAYPRIYLLDKHTPESEEFKTFTTLHCLTGDPESELVSELVPYLDERAVICRKNSTNGFQCADYMRWLQTHSQIKNFVVIGDVLDICVMQYLLSQKKFSDEHHLSMRVILVLKGTDTYHWDEGHHDADLMNLFALYNLRLNGIEIVEDIG